MSQIWLDLILWFCKHTFILKTWIKGSYTCFRHHLLLLNGRIHSFRLLIWRIYCLSDRTSCVLALFLKTHESVFWDWLKTVLNDLAFVWIYCGYLHSKNSVLDCLDLKYWEKEFVFEALLQFSLCRIVTDQWNSFRRNVIGFLVLHCWHNILKSNLLDLFDGSS